MANNTDRIASLSALYQAERTDLTGILGQSLVLVGLAITYMAALVAVFVAQKVTLSPIAIGYLAFPVWMMVAFHSVILALVFAHGQSVRILEWELVRAADLHKTRGAIGAAAGTGATDVDILMRNRRRWGLVGSTIVSYGGFFVFVISFTVASLYWSYVRQQAFWGYVSGFWIPLALYLVCVAIELWAVLYIFGPMREDLLQTPISDPPHN